MSGCLRRWGEAGVRLFKLFQPRFAISPIARADAAAVAAIHKAGFAHGWGETEVLDLVASAAVFGDVAATAGRRKLGGFILSRLAADEAEILTIAVDPRRRGAGLGAQLLRRNLARAKGAGAKAMFLEVDAENLPALALYRRFGFAKVGERKGYYRRPDGSGALALVLRADLS